MAFSGSQITRAGLGGGPRGLYGSFAGKAAVPVRLDLTRLGLYGGPREPYQSFAGKTPATDPGGAGTTSLWHRLYRRSSKR